MNTLYTLHSLVYRCTTEQIVVQDLSPEDVEMNRQEVYGSVYEKEAKEKRR